MRKLKQLMATLAMIVGGVNCVWAYQTPVADGIYYLYNTGVTDGGSGFISRGEDYGKRAVIGQYGIPIQLISTGETDTYYFQLYDTKGWLSDDGFMYTDGGLDGQSEDRRRAIKVELQSDGNYKLLNTNNNKEVENWYGHPVGDGTGNRRDYLWQFLSAAEYEAIVAGYTTTQNMAVASSMGWDLPEQTTASFLNTLSDNYIAIDKTSLIQHASFGTDHSTEGWTFTANASCAFSIGWGNEGGDKTTPEIYTESNKSIAGTISQTVTVEKAGLYKVSVNAFYRSANYAALHEAGCSGSIAYLQANNNKVRIGDIYYSLDNTNTLPSGPNNANNNFFANGKYLNEVYVYVPEDNKTIDISLNIPSYNGKGWFVFNNFKLTYYSEEVSEEDADAILNLFDTYNDKPMQNSVQTALTQAKTTFENNKIISNYNALSSAINNAKVSIKAYESTLAYLNRIDGYLTGEKTFTNFYTTEAYNTYYVNILSKYNDGTLTNEEAAALNADVAYQSGTQWHALNNLDNIMLSVWKQDGVQCNEFERSLLLNTWSIEGNTDGSEFYAPFYEYWVSSANVLAASTMTATITGLKANETYSVTIRARVMPTDNQTMIDNAVMMKVGEGEAVCISAAAKYGTTNYYIGNFSAVGQTDAEGNLVTTITVADASNVSWLSFYNVRYTEGEDLSAYIADYEFALANAQAALTKPMDPNKKDALDTAVTTYASVDNTDKNALIAAKNALEAAMTAANPSIAALAVTSVSDWETTSNNGTFRINTWSKEGDTDGSNMTTPFVENWIDAKNTTPLTDATMSYTMTDEKPGYYKVTALIRSLNEFNSDAPAGVFLFANDAIERAYVGTACNKGVYETPTVYGYVGEDRILKIGVKTIKANFNFLAFKNFTVEYVGTELTKAMAENLTGEARTFVNAGDSEAATAQANAVNALSTLNNANYIAAGQAIEAAYKAVDRDFSGLNAAIQEVNSNLGFEADEYAPYNTFEKLAVAEAIDQESEASTQEEINAAATNLLNAKNAEEVNAIYDGSFNLTTQQMTFKNGDNDQTEYMPIGWTNLGYNTRVYNDVNKNAGLRATSEGAALFAKFTTEYGTVDGYTMPLKAGLYQLSFVYGGWNEVATRDIKIYCGDVQATVEPAAVTAKDNNAHTTKDSWSAYKGYVTIPSDGNYVLSFYRASTTAQNQIAVSDIVLKKAVAESVEMNEADAYEPAYTYADVTLKRKFTADVWNTFCVPFDIDNATLKAQFGDEVAVSTAALTAEAVTFTPMNEPAITANTPVIIKVPNASTTEFTFNGVMIKTGEAKVTGTNAEFVGNYDGQITLPAENCYYIASNKLKKATGTQTMKGFRAYFTTVSGARLSMIIDGEDTTTGIDGVEVAPLMEGSIYNLNGQRVDKAQKGLYIVNGKKVVVK
ncbi:MAG: hypothetical protein IJQ76_10935 [Prevotella sp.]|nr:hypothetical protein [Prevotella sp.]